MTRKIPLQSFGSLRVRTPLVLPGQRIGVMGGSFNPPHAGHQIAAEAAMRRLGLDQVWWLITPGNPLKSQNGLSSPDGRMALVRSFAATIAPISVGAPERRMYERTCGAK